MKTIQILKRVAAPFVLLATSSVGWADVTFTDNFSTAVNYLTNGVAGTMWDGIYLGANALANSTGLGGAAATVFGADADISGNNVLTITSQNTDWENAADDGVFLFKVITNNANFDMSVHIVPPIDTTAYNFPGLMVRAFGVEGSPAPGGMENSLLWARFDEYSIANMSKNNVNGVKTDTGRGSYPNTNYWLRITRSGNTFRLFERTNPATAWVNVGSVTRSDFAGLPLQVGIEHAVFSSGNTVSARYEQFSLTVTNMGPFAAAPSPATGLALTPNADGSVALSWTPGAASSGSLVVMWTGTNQVVKEAPTSGLTYNGNASYGLGSSLPGLGQYVVYAGAGTSVTVSNLSPGTGYCVTVFAYAGSGASIAYTHVPSGVGTFALPANDNSLKVAVQGADVYITDLKPNAGKWYWLQCSDTLAPAHWQNVQPGPVLATSSFLPMTLVHPGGAAASQRFYRLQQLDPLFDVNTSAGAVTSLQRSGDAYPTEYIAGGRRLGDANLKYRPTGTTNWLTSRTSPQTGIASVSYSTSADGTQYTARYLITNSLSGTLVFESVFTFRQDDLFWNLNVTNLTSQSVDLGDLALPLPMNTTYSGITSSAMKHHFISGYGSFIFWMRPNSVGPYLLMTPDDSTKLEYWDVLNGGFETYIHSAAAGAAAATQYPAVTTGGDRWRQPNTSLTLPAGGSQNYGFKFQWANDYDAIRQALVDEGKIDVHIVPGMTLPTNLFAQIALRTTQTVAAVQAEFPLETQVQFLGTTNVSGSGTYQLYQVQFSRLGENKLTIQYGNSRTMFLEFFVTEPLETLIKKRAAYLVATQIITNRWYNALFCDLNMNDGVLVTPDNHDTLGTSFQVYEIASDDAGESRPAYMAVKESVFPVQSEVSALDNYITSFVWGGLQRTPGESPTNLAYGIYGVPDWLTSRSNNPTTNLGRGYDYPHIIVMYYGMYQVAKFHPEITTALSAQEYLTRAWGTAMAMWKFGGGQATHVGLMNELVIADVIRDLVAEGMTNEAAVLRTNWETKVNYYVTGQANLFASEYAFDSTGFESQQAYAKYALQNLGSSVLMGSTNVPAFLQQIQQFIGQQITANVFDRGWLETAYYYYGSDYRGGMGNDYIVTYMSQMGGWGLLDYALYYAADATDYLRLGFASYLNGWSTMNTGTPASNYGFWYPGAAFDGGCGGGFEPSPYNTTWLGGQPMHRGAWYYSAEQNLGFCGAVRSAATILADDRIFGRFCYGGTWQPSGGTNQIVPLDGVRRRFHAMLNGSTLHLVLDNDRFSAGQNILCKDDQSFAGFQIESECTSTHTAYLHLTVSVPGTYTISNNHGLVTTVSLAAGVETIINLPVDANAVAQPFTITR